MYLLIDCFLIAGNLPVCNISQYLNCSMWTHICKYESIEIDIVPYKELKCMKILVKLSDYYSFSLGIIYSKHLCKHNRKVIITYPNKLKIFTLSYTKNSKHNKDTTD